MSATEDHRGLLSPIVRFIVLIALFVLELETVEISLRNYYNASRPFSASIWAPVSGYQRFVFSAFFVFLSALLVATWPRFFAHCSRFQQQTAHYSWVRFLIAQLFAYGLFVMITFALTIHGQALHGQTAIVVVGWAVSMVAVGFLSLLTLAPGRFWLGLVAQERTALLLAGLAAIVTATATLVFIQSWPSIEVFTLRFSETLLRFVYEDVVSNPSTKQLGLAGFKVKVNRACAGYEGIALIIVFLALYLWLFRKAFHFPRVLIIFPIGIVTMWTFNAFRIAALVTIGAYISPDMAIIGFHSNAGWIAFIVVSFGLIGLMHRVPFFIKNKDDAPPSVSAQMATALLAPILVLLAATLLTALFSAGINWLYPLKVIATGIVLGYYWHCYRFSGVRLGGEPILIGVMVFFIWMLLVPASPERSQEMASHLENASPAMVSVWLVFRCLGSIITVPLAEELAFRGYILTRMSGKSPEQEGILPFVWRPFLLSSLLFGLLHGAWVAGTLAGMGYALARYRRGKVADAIIAHMTTNTLLSLYVIMTNEWSYW